MKVISNLFNKFTKKQTEASSNRKFKSLAPAILDAEDLSRIKVYLEALEEVLETPENKNIAVMGNYGSGKTSILLTFMKYHKRYKYLNLSLASFINDNNLHTIPSSGIKQVSDDKINEWQMLEKSLVKQIIYRKKKGRVPYSRFKRINSISRVAFFRHTLLIVSILLSWLVITKNAALREIFSDWSTITDRSTIADWFTKSGFSTIANWIKNTDWSTIPEIIRNVSPIIFILIAMYYIGFLLQLLTKTVKLSKVTFNSLSIEQKDNEESYFSKYLDEILYFFEISGTEIVIIEDIDRFNNLEIFEHLRELNHLLNSSEQVEQTVKFIYALKDSMFEVENADKSGKETAEYIRTKFFDFILPIIPVVDASNSRNHLIKSMENVLSEDKQVQQAKKMDSDMKRYLFDIAIYIDDLRLVYNICNEFRIYKESLEHMKNLDNKQLFAMIVYKNIQPNDFSRLQSEAGLLFNLFHEKKVEIINEIEVALMENLADIKRQLTLVDEEHFNKARAAATFLFEDNVPSPSRQYGYQVSGKSGTLVFNFADKNTIADFLNPTNPISYYNTSQGIWTKLTADKIEQAMRIVGIESFDEYIFMVEEEKETLKDKIQMLKKEIRDTQLLSVQNIMKKNTKLQNLVKASCPDYYLLVTYLLYEGYIDERYERYISNFYEDALSSHDVSIIQKIKANVPLSEEDELQNYELALHTLSNNDYMKIAILNEKIILHIFQNANPTEAERIILDTFKQGVDAKFRAKFLTKILTQSPIKTKFFIQQLLNNDNRLFEDIYDYFDSASDKEEFIFRIFYSCTNVSLENALDADSHLIHEVLAIPGFIPKLREKDMDDFRQFQEIFGIFSFKFSDVAIPLMTAEEINFTLENNLYEINQNNLVDIFVYFTGTTADSFSLSELLKVGTPGLQNYLNNQFGKAVMTLNDIDELHENSETLVRILNDETIEHHLKLTILDKNSYPIDNLKLIKNSEYITAAYESEKYECSLENIVQSVKFDVKFVSEHLQDPQIIQRMVLEFQTLKKVDGNITETSFKFMQKLANEHSFSVNETNIELFALFHEYDVAFMSDSTFLILLENNCIPVTSENISTLKGKNKMRLVHHDEEKVYLFKDSITFTEEELLEGLEILNNKMLNVVIDRSFHGDILNVLDEEEWLEKVIANKILLSPNRIASIIKKEKLKNKQILIDFMVYLLSDKIIPPDTVRGYMLLIEPQVQKIDKDIPATRKLKKSPIEYHDLLKELEKLEIVSRVSRKADYVSFYNTTKL